MLIIVENTVILGIKSVLIEDLDRHMSVPIEKEEVARIKRLGYSNINYIDYIDYIS